MPNSNRNALHSQTLFPNLTSKNTADWAEKLRETAEALLELAQVAAEQTQPEAPHAPPEMRRNPDSEYRTYRIPGFIVGEERSLLESFGADDWQEVLHLARCRLQVISQLLLHYDEDEQIDGLFLNLLAESLLEPGLDTLNRLCSLLADFRPQPET